MRLLMIIEKLLIRITMLALVLLATSQFVLSDSTTTMLDFSIPNYAQEPSDTQVAVGQNIGEKSYVTFELVDYTSLDKASIFVNGKERVNFSDKYATIVIFPGDMVEVDTTFYSKPISIKLLSNDEKALPLSEGTVLVLNGERKVLK